MNVKFRSSCIEDSKWITEALNKPEVAEYLIMINPLTEHEVKEELKNVVKKEDRKSIVAELDDIPVGIVTVRPGKGRMRHVSRVGMYVKKEFWGKGIGTALMKEAIRVAKDYGYRRILLGAYEGNERAFNLYRKLGFETEFVLAEQVYLDGKWRGSRRMSLDLADSMPRIAKPSEMSIKEKAESLAVRQFFDDDLSEINRLQNCTESTKSSSRIPPISREKSKEWYESLSRLKNQYCYGCFRDKKLLGYIRFSTSPQPFAIMWIDEFIVDVNENPVKSADDLASALLAFQKRYAYRKIVGQIPLTNVVLTAAFEKQSFRKAGTSKGNYFIDEHYVDSVTYTITLRQE